MLVAKLGEEARPGINLQSPEVMENPFPTYKILREHYPVCQVGPHDMWAVSRFEDVQYVLANPETFSSKAIDLPYESDWLKEECRNPRLIVAQDPPEHKQYHGLVNKAFLSGAIESLVPLMRDKAQSLLSDFESGEPVDFVEQFSYPYIGKITRHILGVGETQSLQELREWVALEERVQPTRPDDDFIEAYEAVTLRQYGYFLAAIRERRACPQDDLLTHLINAEVLGKRLTDKELCSVMSLLVSAGFATTIQLLNHAVILLSTRPELRAQLVSAPELIPSFVEETLRFSPPLLSTIRITLKDTEISGVSIPKGDFVLPLIASANRDPAKFTDPDSFDLSRPRVMRHFSFGHGIHTCIGAALARLEVKVALEALLSAYKGIDCPNLENLSWMDSMFVRGFTKLPVRFSK